MRTFTFFISIFISSTITSFSQEFQWADKACGYYSDQGYDIAVDTDGKIIFVKQTEMVQNTISIEIDTKDYAKGLYILDIYSGKGKYSTKFLVQ